MKCSLCKEEIEELFLGKVNGTIVKIREGDENKEYSVCNKCQKKFKDKLKDELKK